MTSPTLPDGLVAVVKRDCHTCVLIAPILAELADSGADLAVYTQDDPAFPSQVPGVIDDTDLDVSYHHDIETVPSLLRVKNGSETGRIVGWSRDQWREFTGVEDLAADAETDFSPGCGSLSVDPSMTALLAVRFGGSSLASRRVELAMLEDEMEAMFDRDWSDGLPLVPPTQRRVMAMLDGTEREPSDIVATVPPDLTEASVEKVAINAVMAGARPEYFPVILTALEAVCTDEFNMHGLLATTYFSGPVVVVNGPIAKAIGMNSGGNCLGQGNRANMTIGRALQLVVRNIGGGRPGGVDRSAFGSPGKLSFCFAEDEDGSPWEPLSVERGLAPGTSAVTVFAGHGPSAIVDQLSRQPESLVASMASVMVKTGNPKLLRGFDASLVIGPEHSRIFREAGWDKARVKAELGEHLTLNTDAMLRGVDGIDEGLPAALAGQRLPKFGKGMPLIIHAGGGAGMFSAIIEGWVGGPMGSIPVTREVRP